MIRAVISRSPSRGQHGNRHFEGELENRLLKAHINILENRMKLWLLRTLKRKNLATRDIFFFSKKQGLLRRFDRTPDNRTVLAAMQAKTKDVKKSLLSSITMKKKVRREIIKGIEPGGEGKIHKSMKEINRIVHEKKQVLKRKYVTKINHYENAQTYRGIGTDYSPKGWGGMKAPSQSPTPTDLVGEVGTSDDNNIPSMPDGFEKYKNLSIFGGPKSIPLPSPTLGPFVCNKEIKLSKEELLVLGKDPKFSLAFEPTEMRFLTELERMATKQRYNLNQKNKRKKKSMVASMRLDTGPGDKVPDDRITKLNEVFRENQNKFIFNPVDNMINFNKRRATDYKLNKSIKLPRPMEANDEFQCEMKKREYVRAFKAYQEIQTKRHGKKLGKLSKSNQTYRGIGTDHCPKGWGGMKAPSQSPTPVRTSHMKTTQVPFNLNKQEQIGFKSLIKRVKNKELVITSTDKSSRFSVLSREQYLRAGHEHTKKDKEITWDTVKYLQSQVNGHMWWLSNIVGYAHESDKKRMNNNLQGTSMEVPEMVLLVKDHKHWDIESGKPVPTRPVVSGSRGVNTHISEWLSEIMEPIAARMKSAEVCSTEEVLSKIDKLNNEIESGVDTTQFDVLTEMSSINERKTNAANALRTMNGNISLSNTLESCDENNCSLLSILDNLIISNEQGTLQWPKDNKMDDQIQKEDDYSPSGWGSKLCAPSHPPPYGP